VLDAHWNLIDLNGGARRLASLLTDASTPIRSAGPDRTPFNMLDALAAPEGFSCRITNLSEVGPALVARLRREARSLPSLLHAVQAIEDRVTAQLGSAALRKVDHSPPAPLLTTRFATPLGALAFFSMFTTFGTPQDITLASLRVELLFAADEATSTIWHTAAAASSALN
jgi:hypothetical protein